MKTITSLCAVAAVLSLTPPTTALAQCCGDCGGDGTVAINDLVTAVRNAQQGCPSGPCCGDCDGDGTVAINELVRAVGSALGTCLPDSTAVPTQVRTATPADTATATVPPVPSATATASATPSMTFTATATATPVRAVDNLDGTIRDLTTGLVWEKKVGGDGVPDGSNPQDADNRYPWHGRCQSTRDFCTDGDACPADVACLAGDQQGTRLTIYTWLDALNDSAFAGFTDWRLPSLDELRSLRDLDERPSIDPGFHAPGCDTGCLDLADPDCSCTGEGPYWTTTPDGNDGGRAWRIDFDNGAIKSSNRGDDLRVRAVRGP